MSERDGKPSGWRAMFSDGKWVEEGTAKKPKAKKKAKPKAKAKAKTKVKARPKPSPPMRKPIESSPGLRQSKPVSREYFVVGVAS
jgi:hypothetical protein